MKISPEDTKWIAEIECYGRKIPLAVKQQGHKAILAWTFNNRCWARRINDQWRAEITKYCPVLRCMSFSGAARVVKFVMDNLGHKPMQEEANQSNAKGNG